MTHNMMVLTGFFLWTQVKNAPSPDQISKLQRQLLKELCLIDSNETDAGRLEEEVYKYLKNAAYSFALIIDDVWCTEDGLKLLPSGLKSTFSSSGSWVIITSRAEDVVRSLLPGGDVIKQQKQLADEQQIAVVRTYMGSVPGHDPQLLQQVVKHCHGLPLKLRVLGSMLCGLQLTAWQGRLEGLLRALHQGRNNDLRKANAIFKASIEALEDDALVNVFLDVALYFPKGLTYDKARQWVEVVSDGPDNGISILVEKSLLQWSGRREDSVGLHDAIQDFAEYYVQHVPT